jgi:hypothetical protein
MHLDERLNQSREAIGKQLAVGQKKVSSAFNNIWAEMETMREAQRKRQEENRLLKEKESALSPSSTTEKLPPTSGGGKWKAQAPDLTHAQANIQAAGTRAGAYLSSWGVWASEKKKGWATSKSGSAASTPVTTPLPSPAPIDLKRAEDFTRDKGSMDYSAPLSSARTAPADVEANAMMVRRESVFFDAEQEELAKEKERSKEAESVK